MEILKPDQTQSINDLTGYLDHEKMLPTKLLVEMADRSTPREGVLQAAEALFVRRGYDAVTVKEIAKAAGIHHSSIYHHIPGGKSDLFVEVMTRHLHRHQEGIRYAIEGSDGGLEGQLVAIADWLLSQPPVDLIRLANSDLPAIEAEAAQTLQDLAFQTLLLPIVTILERAEREGIVHHPNLGNVAGAILSSVMGLHTVPDHYIQGSRLQMAEQLIRVFLLGIAQ